jgi:hypothetical protein
MVDEAETEHRQVRAQITGIRDASSADNDALEGMMTSLEEDVEHHVMAEEGEMFPRVEEAIEAGERAELGRRVAARKRELAGEDRTPRAGSAARRPKAAPRRAKGTKRRGKVASARSRSAGQKKRARGGRAR